LLNKPGSFIQFIFLQNKEVKYNFRREITPYFNPGPNYYSKKIDLRSTQFNFSDLKPGEYDFQVFVYYQDSQEGDQIVFYDEKTINLTQGWQQIDISLKLSQKLLLPFELYLPRDYEPAVFSETSSVEILVEVQTEKGSITKLMGRYNKYPRLGGPPELHFSLSCNQDDLPAQIKLIDNNGEEWFLNFSIVPRIHYFEPGIAGLAVRYEHDQWLADGVDDYTSLFPPAIYIVHNNGQTPIIIKTGMPLNKKLSVISGLHIMIYDPTDFSLITESTTQSVEQNLKINTNLEKIYVVVYGIEEAGGHFRLWVQSE